MEIPHFVITDIVEGNTKSLMRLILALAAHYKPGSVKQSHNYRGTHSTSVSGLAQVSILGPLTFLSNLAICG